MSACGKKTSPIVRPTPPPPPTTMTAPPSSTPRPETLSDPAVVAPPAVVAETDLNAKSLDELNRQSPLQPVFYELDSSDLSASAQGVLQTNADLLKKNATWVVTIEGHCDERGTAQYNLALGERRALAARTYLQSLGIAADRMRTVSYGKEFPFDTGHDEQAWSRNRRAHFVITAK
ncbi:MAG: peptidoglycan-associated lipoprotein Pal [Vicinamibacterales bacterium]